MKKKWKKCRDKVGERERTEYKKTNNIFYVISMMPVFKKNLTTERGLLADETCLKGLCTFTAALSNSSCLRTPLQRNASQIGKLLSQALLLIDCSKEVKKRIQNFYQSIKIFFLSVWYVANLSLLGY